MAFCATSAHDDIHRMRTSYVFAYPPSASSRSTLQGGFTLVELSIVLVVIGLIVGGILVGQEMINAAKIHAQITQMEKYQSAVYSFQAKYGNNLPGDINITDAAAFGFGVRGQYAGEGDGNGVIEGVNADSAGSNKGYYEIAGETVMFWVDLSSANLIDGVFNSATSNNPPVAWLSSKSQINAYLPQAKIGLGNNIMVFSNNGANYFQLQAVTLIEGANNGGVGSSAPTLTPQQAFAIDTKEDDGLPQTGRVLAQYQNVHYFLGPNWVAGGALGGTGASNGAALAGSALTCYDNRSVANATYQYSLGYNGGSSPTCALTFRM